MVDNSRGAAKNLLKNTGIFAIGTFGSKVLSLLIIPLCTHFIDTTSMGVYDLDYTIVSLLTPLAMLSASEALFRWMLDEALEKKRVFSTWAPFFALSVLGFTVIYWVAWVIARFEDAALLYLLVVSSCAYGSAQYGTRGLRANKLFAASGIVYSVAYCALTAVLVVWLKVGYRGLLIAILAATVLTTTLLVALQPELRRASRSLFDRRLAKEMLRYSVFLLPNQLCWWALSWLSRLFIIAFLGYSANGVYSVAMKFPSALSMVSSVFFPAWQEQAVTLFGKDGSEGYFSDIFLRYVRIFTSLLLPGVPFTVLFIRVFMDASYIGAADLVALLYLGACLSAFSAFMGALYLCAKDTRGAASTTVVGAVVSAATSLALIPSAGIVGAAVASMLGNLAMFLSRAWQTRRYCVVKVPWLDLCLLSAAAVGFSLVSSALGEAWQLLLLTVIGCVLFLLVNHDSIGWVFGLLKPRGNS